MATQDDIAKKLNISRTTVSRALQGKNVSEETRKRVMELVGKMGYMPNAIATGLASKGKKTVYAFLVATIDEGYAKQMTDGIKEVSNLWREYNFNIEIVLTDININQNQAQTQLKQFYSIVEKGQVSGIIFSALSKENMEKVEAECANRKIPLMTLDMIYYTNSLCHVGPDYFELGTFSAAYISQLIMRQGKILTISFDEGYLIGKERMRGFFSKMKSYKGIEVFNVDIEKISKEIYWEVLEQYLNQKSPVAIYAPYHVEYIAEYLESHRIDNDKYVLIANGVNKNIEKYLFSGMINGIVSAKPYYLGAVVANNFFKYFFRNGEMVKGRIDVKADIYIAENYQRQNKIL